MLFLTFVAALTFSRPHITPAEPTSATPVVLTVSETDTCPPPPVVTITGTTIKVVLGDGPCLAPPVLITHEIELGLLAPGDYEVVVVGTDQGGAHLSFFVRDAEGTVTVRPSIGATTGGTPVTIVADVRHCQGQDLHACPPPAITFDGFPAANVEVIESSLFRAVAPAHVAGPAVVQVRSGEFTRVTRAGFRYYDRAAQPLASMFERVLLPVYHNGPGAYGSQWVTEVRARNSGSGVIEPFRGPAIPVERPQQLVFAEPVPKGVLLFLPREAADSLHFQTLARDTSRQAADWGTEIPVVRESAFRSDAIELLNIPIDPRFRVTLRVYGLESLHDSVRLTVYSMSTGASLDSVTVNLSGASECGPSSSCASDAPAHWVNGDFAAAFAYLGAGQDRIGIRLEPMNDVQPIWAFATITNNETQHVTVISPQ